MSKKMILAILLLLLGPFLLAATSLTSVIRVQSVPPTTDSNDPNPTGQLICAGSGLYVSSNEKWTQIAAPQAEREAWDMRVTQDKVTTVSKGFEFDNVKHWYGSSDPQGGIGKEIVIEEGGLYLLSFSMLLKAGTGARMMHAQVDLMADNRVIAKCIPVDYGVYSAYNPVRSSVSFSCVEALNRGDKLYLSVDFRSNNGQGEGTPSVAEGSCFSGVRVR